MSAATVPHARRRRLLDTGVRGVGRAAVAICALAMLAPPLVVVVLSFSADRFLGFPPRDWGLRQYHEVLTGDTWLPAIWLSLKIALPSTLIALLVGVPASLAIVRSRLRGRIGLQLVGVAGVVVPVSAYAVAMYAVYAQLGLLSSYWGLVIANTMLALPFVLVMVPAALTRVPVELELAAMTLGAGRFGAWLRITLPLVLPAIVGAGVVSFVTAFDEAVLINFLGGPDLVTLPKAIFDSVRYGVDPAITAIATALMLTTGAILLLPHLLRKDAA